MSSPISGVGQTVQQSPIAGGRATSVDNGGLPDLGPAAVFTPTEADQSANITMYNGAGDSIAMTQWLRAGTSNPTVTAHPTADIQA